MLTSEIPSPLITFHQPETSPKTPQPPDIYYQKEFKLKILTHMELEEVMMKSWLEEPSLTPESLINYWEEKSVLTLYMFQLVKLWLSMMPLKDIKKKATN